MTSRRASNPAAERVNLGDAFQIYSEIVNVGKTVEGSKKKVRWVFGFTESDREYEVVMIHSVVSGKKTILEDGKEIVSSMNMLQSDFSHGWTSMQTHRFFRIEANMGLTQDSYTFSIDGIRFIDMPKKPVGGLRRGSEASTSRYGSGDMGSNTNNNTSSSGAGSTTRRASTGAISNPTPPTKSPNDTRHIKSVPSGSSFDPFADNHNTSSPDPFANPSSNNNNNKSAAVNLFDTTEEPTPAPKNNFDPFTAGSDPFAQPATPKSSHEGFDNFDPFSSPSSAPANNGGASTNPAVSKLPAPAPQPSNKSHTSSTNDLFGFDNQPSATTTNKPQRRASAQEISLDFAGLSFVEPNQKAAQPVVMAPQPVVEPVAEKPAAPVDPWATNLVDLDLSGRATQNQRRQSTNPSNGPSLDNLMGTGGPQRRTSMMAPNNMSNNDILASYPQANNNDPFGAPNGVMRPAPTPISAMGMQPNGYATAPMPPQQNVRGSINMGQPMMMQQSPAMGGMPMNPRASFTSSVPLTNSMGYATQPPPPKSSLDSLDWKM